jgi:hypothetical protein
LDNLFYRDAIEQRVREVGLPGLRKIVPAAKNEADDAYMSRLVDLIGLMFAGYSIVHVAGRFRLTEALISRSDAGDMISTGERYLIDETTAAVRFIVPCQASRRAFDMSPSSANDVVAEKDASFLRAVDIQTEISQIRALFFMFFVETITRSVRGEDEIWLIESSPSGQALFVWQAKSP